LGESKRENKEIKIKKTEIETKVKEDPDNVKYDNDELDLDDEDDIDPLLNELSLRDAVPTEFKVLDKPPKDLNAVLIGASFAMKWTYTGWSVGKFSKYYAKPRTKNQFNFETIYVSEVRDHRFQLKDYSTSDDAPYGSWCILQRPDHAVVSYCA
jgi:hypothetical protein